MLPVTNREKITLSLRSYVAVIAIYAAFFLSGASSLCAEVTWNRMLIVVVGNSMSAAAMIIIVFMGGLGLGSYAGGKVWGRRRPSLIPYILLEVAIGAYILCSPMLFKLFSYLFSSLAESVSDRASLTFVRVVVSMAALFLPAFLMGATFPAVVSGADPGSPLQRSARTGFLYSINTIGAAVGCYVGGYHLLFEAGVRTTLNFAVSLNVAAALCAVVAIVLREKRASVSGETCDFTAVRPVDGGLRRFLNVATFCIGFVALAYEVFLTRMVILFLNNVASTFALVLTGYLIGTGIGALLGTWIYGVLRRTTRHADRFFGFISLASGALIIATPYYLLTLATTPLHALVAIIVPMVLIGSLLPIAIRMYQTEERSEATKEAATLYALNTIGGLLGAGIVNHLLVPRIGLQGGLILLTLICFTAGIVNLLSPGKNFLRWGTVATCTVVLALALSFGLPHLMTMYAGKIAEWTRARQVDIRLVQEGRAATVTVLDQSDPKLGTYRDMYLNGVEEASTRYYHTQLFKLLGVLPVLVHGSDKQLDAAVIAFGAGITAGSVLASDQVASLDVVDLNPDVEGINNLFKDVNGDVFHQPRFHFHNDDGRNYLVTSGKKYDLIISDSTHPCAYDSWILYTQEFYRDVRKRLLPGGVFAQWVPVTNNLRGELFRIHLNTFRSVFPDATFWYVYGSNQALLLSTPAPFAFDVRRIQQRLDKLPPWFKAKEYQIDTAARLAGFFWLDAASMSAMIGRETRINTDDRHYFEKQSVLKPDPPRMQLPQFQADMLPHVGNVNDNLRTAIRNEQRVAFLLGRYGFYFDQNDLRAAYCFMPENGNVRYWMSEAFEGMIPKGICR